MTDENLLAVPDLKDAPITPATALCSIALTMAMKYHDINTVKDGALYQQYKLEGKNMTPLHLDAVFETAIRIEHHLIIGASRIANIVENIVEAELGEAIADAAMKEHAEKHGIKAPDTKKGRKK